MTVFRPRYGNNYAIWVKCPSCGPMEPLMDGEFFAPTQITGQHLCSKCLTPAPYRECLLPERDGAGRCGRRCWNAKYECGCVCEGKCHSEGECYCVKVAA